MIAEADRPGRFDVAVADALGVPPGRERGLLQRGEAVVLASGETVTPEQVLGPARPSRSLALTGDTGPAASVVEAATGVDLLIHEATFCADERQRARETNHSTAAEAALARQGGGRRAARPDPPLEPLLRRARSRRRRASCSPPPSCRATST